MKYIVEIDEKLKELDKINISAVLRITSRISLECNKTCKITHCDDCDLIKVTEVQESESHKCIKCGCTGNKSCGHEPVDKSQLCALDENETCGCCKAKESENK